MINKNANGTNKLERQKNKAKKYLNIELVDYSNTYWHIGDYDRENTFILFTNFRIVKNGELVIIEPLNRVREYFKKSFAVIYEERPYYYNAYVIFKSYGDKQHEELMELVSGYDDIYLLKDWIDKNQHTKNHMLVKKITSGYVDNEGKFYKTKSKEIEARPKAENGGVEISEAEALELLEELE